MGAENRALLDQESALSCPGGGNLEDMLRSRRAILTVLALLLGLWPFLAAAKNATPTSSNSAPLDLAAMALAPADVPAGYFDDYSEWWVPSGPFSDVVPSGTAIPPG